MISTRQFHDLRSGRPWLRIAASRFGETLPEVLPQAGFVLFIAADTEGLPEADLVPLCRELLAAGARCVCCWGPGAEELETAFDLAAIAILEEADAVVPTSSHPDEPLEEAVWYALFAAWPDPAFDAAGEAVVLLAAGREDWSDGIDAYLAAGAPMPEET